jgi:hypothetical protein
MTSTSVYLNRPALSERERELVEALRTHLRYAQHLASTVSAVNPPLASSIYADVRKACALIERINEEKVS